MDRELVLEIVFFHHQDIAKYLLLTNSQIRKRIFNFGRIESRICRECNKKVCKCWSQINFSQFLEYRVCSEEVEMFGPQLITAWSNVKFIKPVSNFESISYTLSLFVIDRILIELSHCGIFKQIFRRMKHNFREADLCNFFLPVKLYSDKSIFICPSRFSSCMKRISKKVIKLKNKKVLQRCCEEISSNLYLLKY